MTSDTLKQKYLYNVPLLDNEMPMFKNDIIIFNQESIRLPLSLLYEKDNNSFKQLLLDLKKMGIKNIILYNDISFLSDNIILKNAIQYYINAFAYWFKKNKFIVTIEKDSD